MKFYHKEEIMLGLKRQIEVDLLSLKKKIILRLYQPDETRAIMSKTR
jgi:hypothetical protein